MPKGHRKKGQTAASPSASKLGSAPGEAIYVGAPRTHEVSVRVFDYAEDGVKEMSRATAAELEQMRASKSINWIDIDGIHDVEAVRTVCDTFGVHPLAMEDILNPSTRPKVDDYGTTVFVAVKMATPSQERVFELEQVALVLGPTWVLSFGEREGDLFDPLRNRIRRGVGRIRRMGSDYLLHGILDAVVDGYFAILELVEEAIGALEEDVIAGRDRRDVARNVHELKGHLNTLRRLIWPMRDATASLLRAEGRLVSVESEPFFRDLNDHVHQVIDLLDANRDRLTSVLELHLAMTSHRMNDVMKVLTVVSTLFIPLTFIVGVYGMNFKHMPELGLTWGYGAVWVAMLLVAAGMTVWFRRQGWW